MYTHSLGSFGIGTKGQMTLPHYILKSGRTRFIHASPVYNHTHPDD